jgi:hypothetical protein
VTNQPLGLLFPRGIRARHRALTPLGAVGPLWRRENEVFVGGRNRTALARAVEHQLAAVLAAVRSDESLNDVSVYGALCFLESDWGLLDFPFSVGKIWITYPGALQKQLRKPGPLSRERMERVARRLDLSLPAVAAHL